MTTVPAAEIARRRLIGLAFTAVGVLVIALTFRDYGVTWDDGSLARYGELVLDYFRSGMTDRRCDGYYDLRYYGPLVESLAAALYRAVGNSPFEIRHFVSALFGLAGVWGTIRYARLLPDPWVGRFAGAVLALLPAWYGSAFINSKDIPFACFFTWSLFALARILVTGEATWGRVVACGAAIGLTLSVRMGGVLLFGYAGAAGLFWLCSGPPPRWRPCAARTLVVPLVAWIVLVAFWPWLHEDPFGRPIAAFLYPTKMLAAKQVLFGGRTMLGSQVPWHYLATLVTLTTPLGVLALALVGAGAAIASHVRRRRSPESLVGFLTLFWFGFPMAYFAVMRPAVYNGMRHFLFVLPALAVLAGMGAAWLIGKARAGRRRIATTTMLAAIVLTPTIELVRLHPYQATYFNVLAGGVEGAYRNYETDYWATSYKEAMEWLAERARQGGTGRIRVLVAANEFCLPCAEYYADPQIELSAIAAEKPSATLPEGIDYYLGMTAHGHAENYFREPIVHEVGREGAVFAVIRQRSGK